jgi:hypothetical protein
MTMHLYSNHSHDECEVWCDVYPYYDPPNADATQNIEKATCHACLDAVLGYAGKAVQRKLDLVDERIKEMKAAKP